MNDDLHALRVCRQQAGQLREMAATLRAEADGLDIKAAKLDQILRIAEAVGDQPVPVLRRRFRSRLGGTAFTARLAVPLAIVLAIAISAVTWSFVVRDNAKFREGDQPASFSQTGNPSSGEVIPPMVYPTRPPQNRPAVLTAVPAPQPLPPPPNNGGPIDSFLKQ